MKDLGRTEGQEGDRGREILKSYLFQRLTTNEVCLQFIKPETRGLRPRVSSLGCAEEECCSHYEPVWTTPMKTEFQNYLLWLAIFSSYNHSLFLFAKFIVKLVGFSGVKPSYISQHILGVRSDEHDR